MIIDAHRVAFRVVTSSPNQGDCRPYVARVVSASYDLVGEVVMDTTLANTGEFTFDEGEKVIVPLDGLYLVTARINLSVDASLPGTYGWLGAENGPCTLGLDQH